MAGQIHPVDPVKLCVGRIESLFTDIRTYQYQGGLRNPDGTTPRRSEYAALTANITSSTPAALADARKEMTEFIGFQNKTKLAAENLFKAHKQAIGEMT